MTPEGRSKVASAMRLSIPTDGACCSRLTPLMFRIVTVPYPCSKHRGDLFPFVELAFADSAYAGERVASATPVSVQIVRKLEGQIGFEVHARRWVVERFFAWIGRNRRLAKDFEATIASATAFLYAASVMLLVRRIARKS